MKRKKQEQPVQRITEVLVKGRPTQNERVVELANALLDSDPVRAADPADWWEQHPVIGNYLDLKDWEIMGAINAVAEIDPRFES